MKKYLKIIVLIGISIVIGVFIGLKSPSSADLNRDGVVNELDYSLMMSQWTK